MRIRLTRVCEMLQLGTPIIRTYTKKKTAFDLSKAAMDDVVLKAFTAFQVKKQREWVRHPPGSVLANHLESDVVLPCQ
jgi:hypothetical protein